MYLHVPDYIGVLQGFWVWNGNGWIYSLIIKCMIIVWGFEMVMVGYIRLRWLTLLAGCKAFWHKCWELWCCRISWSLDAKMFGGHAVFQAHLPPMDNPSPGPAPGNPAAKWNGPSTPEWVFPPVPGRGVPAPGNPAVKYGCPETPEWMLRRLLSESRWECSRWLEWEVWCSLRVHQMLRATWKSWLPHLPRWSLMWKSWCHKRMSGCSPLHYWRRMTCLSSAQLAQSLWKLISSILWRRSWGQQKCIKNSLTGQWHQPRNGVLNCQGVPILNGLAKQGAQSTCEARTCWNCVFLFHCSRRWHGMRCACFLGWRTHEIRCKTC